MGSPKGRGGTKEVNTRNQKPRVFSSPGILSVKYCARTYVELTGKWSKAGLTINARKDMESELFWAFDDDLLALWIPTYHVLILWFLKKSKNKQSLRVVGAWARNDEDNDGIGEMWHTCKALWETLRTESCWYHACQLAGFDCPSLRCYWWSDECERTSRDSSLGWTLVVEDEQRWIDWGIAMNGGVDVVEQSKEETQANESRLSVRCKCRSSQREASQWEDDDNGERRCDDGGREERMGKEKGNTHLRGHSISARRKLNQFHSICFPPNQENPYWIPFCTWSCTEIQMPYFSLFIYFFRRGAINSGSPLLMMNRWWQARLALRLLFTIEFYLSLKYFCLRGSEKRTCASDALTAKTPSIHLRLVVVDNETFPVFNRSHMGELFPLSNLATALALARSLHKIFCCLLGAGRITAVSAVPFPKWLLVRVKLPHFRSHFNWPPLVAESKRCVHVHVHVHVQSTSQLTVCTHTHTHSCVYSCIKV